jgi:cytoskeletal protein RodZ
LSLKSISEALAVLGGVALMTGCGSAQKPVNATEVDDAKPAAGATVENKVDDSAASATDAAEVPKTETPAEVTPASTATAEATPAATATATATAAAAAAPKKPAGTGSKTAKGGKKKGAEMKCGEGSCG